MNGQNATTIWHVRPPSAAAEAPEWMSFSRLREIEACPRRWSLGAASYPDVWSGRGYPRKEHLATLTGQVIHNSLDKILRALTQAGCASVRDACFVGVLRALGGYSKIIEDAINDAEVRLRANPRHSHNVESLTDNLRADIPELRARLQRLASRLRLEGVQARRPGEGSARARQRSALSPGSYSELELRDESKRWHGYVDAITISDGRCEIVDYKTGEPKPEHRQQVHIYNLLWARDEQLNPASRPVTSLTLLYPDRDVDVTPLTEAELTLLEQELASRTKAALESVRRTPPPAFPTLQNCSHCPVRHLCEDYWTLKAQQRLLQESISQVPRDDIQHVDLEVSEIEQQTSSIWAAKVHSCRLLPPNTQVMIRAGNAHPAILTVLKNERRVRIIDALIQNVGDEGKQTSFVVLTKFSEAFIALRD